MRFTNAFVGFQIYLFVFDDLPKPLHKDIITPATLAVHADRDAFLLQQPGKCASGELTAMVGVEDLGTAISPHRLFARPDVLGMIRDIVDETLAIVILVGMQNAREKLLQVNEYYFDRCNIFYEFAPVTKPDIALLCKEVLEVKTQADIVDYVHFHACGSMRKAMKLFHTIEQTAKAKNLVRIGAADLN